MSFHWHSLQSQSVDALLQSNIFECGTGIQHLWFCFISWVPIRLCQLEELEEAMSWWREKKCGSYLFPVFINIALHRQLGSAAASNSQQQWAPACSFSTVPEPISASAFRNSSTSWPRHLFNTLHFSSQAKEIAQQAVCLPCRQPRFMTFEKNSKLCRSLDYFRLSSSFIF